MQDSAARKNGGPVSLKVISMIDDKFSCKGSVAFKILMLLLFIDITAMEYTGIVVESGDNSKPIPDVLVSAGYTCNNTHTDKNGKFSIQIETAGAISNNIKKHQIRVKWDKKNGLINLENLPFVSSLMMYNLNGRLVFSTRASPSDNIYHIPETLNGICIIAICRNNKTVFSSQLNTISSSTISIPASISANKVGEQSQPVTLLFRNDNYYPVNISLNQPSQAIVVKMKYDKRAYIFDTEQIHKYSFNISVEDSLKMEKDALLENYVPASFSFDSTLFGTVGLRYKGSTFSLMGCFNEAGERKDSDDCKKIPLKVKFNEYADTSRLYSLNAVCLNSMSYDPSKMHEILSFELFRKMGIYSPRASYAQVFINNVFQGLFLSVEPVDQRFIKSRWPENDGGNLYKDAWPVSGSSDYYIEHLENNNDSGDILNVEKMTNLYTIINGSTIENFDKIISKSIDVDYFTRYFSVDRAINNWDGITAWYWNNGSPFNHNYFFYEGDKIWLIPWDLDNTLEKQDLFIDVMKIPNWNETPASCEPVIINSDLAVLPSNCDKFIKMLAQTQMKKFVQAGDELLANYFKYDSIAIAIDKYKKLIEPAIKRDPYINYDTWQTEVLSLKEGIKTIQLKYDSYIHGLPESGHEQ